MNECGHCLISGSFKSRCSRCKVVYYCSKDCQLDHWKTHKQSCNPPDKNIVEMKSDVNVSSPLKLFTQRNPLPTIIPKFLEVKIENQFKGRGVFATKDFNKGDILFNEIPFIFASQHHESIEDDRQCGYCYKPSPFIDIRTSSPYKPIFCRNNCSKTIYCSIDCEKYAYKHYHEYMCTKSDKLSNSSIKALNNLRIHCKKTKYRYPLMMAMIISNYLSNPSENYPWQHIFAPNIDATGLQDKWYTELNILQELFLPFPKVKGFLNMDVYLQFCGMFRSNAILVRTNGVTTGTSDEDKLKKGNWCQGPGLFLFASLMNHSCYPNVEIERTMTSLTNFRATESIKKGDEICIDYLNLFDDYGPIAWNSDVMSLPEDKQLDIIERFIHRQNEVKENYQCFCACRLCVRDHALSKTLY